MLPNLTRSFNVWNVCMLNWRDSKLETDSKVHVCSYPILFRVLLHCYLGFFSSFDISVELMRVFCCKNMDILTKSIKRWVVPLFPWTFIKKSSVKHNFLSHLNVYYLNDCIFIAPNHRKSLDGVQYVKSWFEVGFVSWLNLYLLISVSSFRW